MSDVPTMPRLASSPLVHRKPVDPVDAPAPTECVPPRPRPQRSPRRDPRKRYARYFTKFPLPPPSNRPLYTGPGEEIVSQSFAAAASREVDTVTEALKAWREHNPSLPGGVEGYVYRACGIRDGEVEDDESIHSNCSVAGSSSSAWHSSSSEESSQLRTPPFVPPALPEIPKQERTIVASLSSSSSSSIRDDEHSSTIGDVCLIRTRRPQPPIPIYEEVCRIAAVHGRTDDLPCNRPGCKVKLPARKLRHHLELHDITGDVNKGSLEYVCSLCHSVYNSWAKLNEHRERCGFVIRHAKRNSAEAATPSTSTPLTAVCKGTKSGKQCCLLDIFGHDAEV
ncbi:hypothetical protein K474DRAFT_49623 [Panus rudis PR-1116 ss-1]|nr:hypothetical protein K474DRAFT_49623 [Panus rudis PR-1116 ss-1]